MQKFFGQSAQDYFVIKCLKEKKQGTFVEIGSNHPIGVNNTFLLEYVHGWCGFMIEYNDQYVNEYKMYRPRSIHMIRDATTINFREEFEKVQFPKEIDYLQIDLDVENRSTLTTLENMDKQVFDDYKFATITFEHDIYRGDYFETRRISREIFAKHGYFRVFPDVHAGPPYGEHEDWYVHPDLVDMNFIHKIKTEESLRSDEIVKRLDFYSNSNPN
jgi:hypothetical protein